MLRTSRIVLVATPYERQVLEKAAKESGTNLSNYLRMAGFRMAKIVLSEKEGASEYVSQS